MFNNGDFELGFMIGSFALLGAVVIGSLLASLGRRQWHAKLLGAVLGALLGVAMIEAVPMVV